MSDGRSFYVDTAAGRIEIAEWTDPGYPGLTVYQGPNRDRQVAVVECKVYDSPNVVYVHVWFDDAQDPVYSNPYGAPAGGAAPGAGFAIDTPAGVICPVPMSGGATINVNNAPIMTVNGASGSVEVEVVNYHDLRR